LEYPRAIFAESGAIMTRHIVVFKYKRTATETQIGQVTDAFRGLKDRIPGNRTFEHGDNNSPEGKDHGYTHVHGLTFDD